MLLPSDGGKPVGSIFNGLFLVLVIGGRDYINPPKQRQGKEYTWYISDIYCQLGDYILPTSHSLRSNLKNPLIF